MNSWHKNALRRTAPTAAMALAIWALSAPSASASGRCGGRSYTVSGPSYQVYSPPASGYGGFTGYRGPGGPAYGSSGYRGYGYGGPAYGYSRSYAGYSRPRLSIGIGTGGFGYPGSRGFGYPGFGYGRGLSIGIGTGGYGYGPRFSLPF